MGLPLAVHLSERLARTEHLLPLNSCSQYGLATKRSDSLAILVSYLALTVTIRHVCNNHNLCGARGHCLLHRRIRAFDANGNRTRT